ncbi:MAG: ABC transporter ATP-binding protein [Planctomycetota bacterium]|nr:ABC transporter ATP-binding protein [Planctomycetota bacterium]
MQKTPPTAATGISIANLCKNFAPSGGKAGPAAVNNISLTIEPGELFFLLGPSGCGKTTLLRMIAGFIEPTSGVVQFVNNGKTSDVTHLPPEQRNAGMVFQSYALWPHMSVFDNVAFGLEVRKVFGSERKQRVEDALAAVQMSEYADRKPNQLSGGQQQRIALARAVVVRPNVLLLDEPLSNLDAKLRIELRSEIRRLCKRFGMTTVYVTHDQKEALSMADRIAILRAGQVVQVGTPGDLYRSPTTQFVASFLGETNFIRGTVTAAHAGECQIDCGSFTLASTSAAKVGDTVVLSVRPETITVGLVGHLRGTISERTYLGEAMQYRVNLGSTTVTAAVHNPDHPGLSDGESVTLSVRPQDVVIVAE